MTKLITREQYEADPHSKALRDITVRAVQDVETLLYAEPEDKEHYYAEIEALCGQLIGMGVVSDMHVGKPQEFFSDPIHAAEYCAGQLLTNSGKHIVSEEDALPGIQEFSIHQSESMHLVEAANLPRPVLDFVALQGVANMILYFLDEV